MMNEATVQSFKTRLRGDLIQPGDASFDLARKVYNAMIDRRPRLIAKVADVADVITCVNFGRDENLRIAVDALRVSKMRSSLTILGVVIGVATVMAMAAIVEGIRKQIVATIEIAGPTTFYVMKKFSQTPLYPDNLPKDVRITALL